MRNTFMTLLLAFSTFAHAGLTMKPGKWQIESKMPGNGPEGDPMSAMHEAMKNMPPEQRKMMEEAMNKAMKEQSKNKNMPNIKMSEKGATICLTQEMIESDMGFRKQYEDQKCKITNHQKTSSSMNMSFNCDDGSTGDVKVTITDPTHYIGKVKLIDEGEKTEIELKGTFLSEKCD